ncbi:MAG: hypothetical protein ACOCUU_01485 [Nanoarchaeota archaeon]
MNRKIFSVFNKNKKASGLPAEMVIIIILALVGFALVVWFLYSQLSWEGMVDRETCHQSVVLRGASWDKWHSSSKDLVPLKCKTRNICVTEDKNKVDKCENYWEKFDIVVVSENKLEQKKEIMRLFADEMATCFWMMGEGRLQIFKRDNLKGEKRGVICSNIMLEPENTKIKSLSNFHDMGKYLLAHSPPQDEKVSYWEYLIHAHVGEGLLTRLENPEASNKESSVIDLTEVQSVVFLEFDPSKLSDILSALGLGSAGAWGGAKLGATIGVFIPVPGASVVLGGIGFIGGGAAGLIGGGEAGEELGTGINNYFNKDDYTKHTDKVRHASSIFIAEYSAESFNELGIDSLESIG